jgi:mannose-6-phosphate isomerase-like protein (cupin superfamily)
MSFHTRLRGEAPDAIAPDGSEVRLLAATPRGSMAEFTLPPGAVSVAVAHRTVEEVWCVLRGQGRMWRRRGEDEETVVLKAGVSVSILPGTSFQFRNDGSEPLKAVAVTMPPWPGMEEAYAVPGRW